LRGDDQGNGAALDEEQAVTGGWLTAEYSMLPYSTQLRRPERVTISTRHTPAGHRSPQYGYSRVIQWR
jgi:hypothetical protein